MLREEYRHIVDAGILLQVDDAVLMHECRLGARDAAASFADYRRWAELRVDALNHALRGLPHDRVRYHVCWGSWHGPHAFDPPLADVIDLVLKVTAGYYLIEQANPRHEHEWSVWEDVKLPEGKVLVPGVVTHHTNVVEHPELVAERLVRVAELVGRDHVMGGTDCGFAQSAFTQRVHPRSSGPSCARSSRARGSRATGCGEARERDGAAVRAARAPRRPRMSSAVPAPCWAPARAGKRRGVTAPRRPPWSRGSSRGPGGPSRGPSRTPCSRRTAARRRTRGRC